MGLGTCCVVLGLNPEQLNGSVSKVGEDLDNKQREVWEWGWEGYGAAELCLKWGLLGRQHC